MQRVQDRISGEQHLKHVRYQDTAATIGVNDNLVLSAGNGITITLPPVAEAMGQIYTLVKTVAAGSLTVTGAAIATGQTAADEVTTNVVLANADDFVTVLSTGLHWITLAIKR